MKQATIILFILIWSILKSFAQMPLSGNLVAGEASFVDKESGEKKVNNFLVAKSNGNL